MATTVNGWTELLIMDIVKMLTKNEVVFESPTI